MFSSERKLEQVHQGRGFLLAFVAEVWAIIPCHCFQGM